MALRARAWLLVAILSGCLEYSPHQLPTDPDEQDLNRKGVERIVSRPVDRLLFAVIGDTQRGFDEAEDVVDAINRRDDIQFVVQIGDFTNVGLWLEYRLMNEIFARLRVPYLVGAAPRDPRERRGRPLRPRARAPLRRLRARRRADRPRRLRRAPQLSARLAAA
jgi:hypothetical protein